MTEQRPQAAVEVAHRRIQVVGGEGTVGAHGLGQTECVRRQMGHHRHLTQLILRPALLPGQREPDREQLPADESEHAQAKQIAVLDQTPRGAVESGWSFDDQLMIGQQHVGLADLDRQAELDGQLAGLEKGRRVLVQQQFDGAEAEERLHPPRSQAVFARHLGRLAKGAGCGRRVGQPVDPRLRAQGFAEHLGRLAVPGGRHRSRSQASRLLDPALAMGGIGEHDQRSRLL